MGTRLTLEDVAARAGVSRALVSIVIRGAPGASQATTARVLQAAAEIGVPARSGGPGCWRAAAAGAGCSA